MKPWLFAFGVFAASSAFAQMPTDRNVFVPDTSVARAIDAGHFAHTNHLIYVGPPTNWNEPIPPQSMPTFGPAVFATPSGFHPDQIRTAYNVSGSGSGTIAVVIAYHYKTSLGDFNVFSAQFGLPQESSSNMTSPSNTVFQVVYANGSQPRADGGWGQEAAMDIEWTHAMAPNAKIVLVEAASNSFSNLMKAVDVARGLPNVKCVSMSWGSNEFSGETGSGYDGHFTTGGPFFASSGDSGGVISWPAVSRNVIGVGGTHLVLDGTNQVSSETVWSGTGCGPSAYESRPTFQDVVQSVVGSSRGSADVSGVADPYTGIAVYDSTAYRGYVGWMVFGGTSASCPISAGIFNSNGSRSSDSSSELNFLYGGSSSHRDITSGTAGSYSARIGYDFPTGLGSPNGSSSL